MAKIPSFFSLKHLLVLSLALNVSLIMRVVFEDERQGPLFGFSLIKPRGSSMADTEASQRTLLATSSSSSISSSAKTSIAEVEDSGEKLVNLDHGDPTMYENYWEKIGEKTTIVIRGWDSMSYFSDLKSICWFLEPEFAKQVVRLHKIVGNAETEGRHVVVGTGSSQLYLAALFALSPKESTQPIHVVSAAPYYSSYPSMTDYQKSGLHKWAGDANNFTEMGPYIELITSPNNPDGFVRHSCVNKTGGAMIYDLAYYWPQYTPISSPADNDLSLFTVSKSTGHAGIRIGWALVKDPEVARRMTKFVELNTIGVSKDSQIRAAKILEVVADSCEQSGSSDFEESFFEFSYHLMEKRWQQLRETVSKSGGIFSLPQFSPAFCHFHSKVLQPHPAFAWLRCKDGIEDCESFLKGHKILTRGGRHFGASSSYVRVSMLDRDDTYKMFLKRLSSIR
ncbi:tryptophan aminotransferase-related protein 2 [Cannabis sativa]|uniref:tryptophan aminotransferase-related protein 2 n=1 Tax=Cannabis sativa TaxID=3483 RepID=UPI0029CA94BF|nr:tryptophan aminotransferase-related protein 2 [Cannabis sativa]